jgi:surface antigen
VWQNDQGNTVRSHITEMHDVQSPQRGLRGCRKYTQVVKSVDVDGYERDVTAEGTLCYNYQTRKWVMIPK